MTGPIEAVVALHNAFRRDIAQIDAAALEAARVQTPGDPELLAAAEWAAKIFGASETAVAVLTSTPAFRSNASASPSSSTGAACGSSFCSSSETSLRGTSSRVTDSTTASAAVCK